MSILNWITMSMVVDIAFVVFAIATVWKLSRIQKNLSSSIEKINELEINIAYHKVYSQDLAKRIDLQTKSIVEISEDVELTMRNPLEARRLFKHRQK